MFFNAFRKMKSVFSNVFSKRKSNTAVFSDVFSQRNPQNPSEPAESQGGFDPGTFLQTHSPKTALSNCRAVRGGGGRGRALCN